MPRPRKQQVILSETPYYHCVSRCVRRAFLCGVDLKTEKSFEHRRGWVEKRLLFLSSVYTIDICAFAVMSNHTHIVVKINSHKVKELSEKEVLQRWHQIHFGTLLSRQYCEQPDFDEALLPTIKATVAVYRDRLADLSWFMKDLNEFVARLANAEDECTGRFWEGRFTSQALLDEASLLACMAYVDLNPVRAQMASDLTKSDHTSVQLRIKSAIKGEQPGSLLPFTGDMQENKACGIAYKVNHYLQLIDETGRCMRNGKRGFINQEQQSLLVLLNISADNWLAMTQNFEVYFKGAVGAPDSTIEYIRNNHLKRRPNHANSAKYFA